MPLDPEGPPPAGETLKSQRKKINDNMTKTITLQDKAALVINTVDRPATARFIGAQSFTFVVVVRLCHYATSPPPPLHMIKPPRNTGFFGNDLQNNRRIYSQYMLVQVQASARVVACTEKIYVTFL